MEKEAQTTQPMADTSKKPRQSRRAGAGQEADEDPVGKVYDSRLVGRLARYVRPYWLQAAVSSVSVTLKSVCDVTGPIMVMMAIDRYLRPT